MGWFLVSLAVPSVLPLVMLGLLKLVDLPDEFAARSSPLRAVREGQLGWVAMSFAAACTYEVWSHTYESNGVAPSWTGPVLFMSICLLLVSGLLSMAGTLFPFDESKQQVDGIQGWLVRYKLFAATALATVLTALLYALVHFQLPGAAG